MIRALLETMNNAVSVIKDSSISPLVIQQVFQFLRPLRSWGGGGKEDRPFLAPLKLAAWWRMAAMRQATRRDHTGGHGP